MEQVLSLDDDDATLFIRTNPSCQSHVFCRQQNILQMMIWEAPQNIKSITLLLELYPLLARHQDRDG